ncbi:MAG TPA: hypothetical protein VGP46_01865 [Acidimicrobiales bacterium]|jgi:hypothetical protein|nr:hypothetical protein [Acidimicrobiales bacterium]
MSAPLDTVLDGLAGAFQLDRGLLADAAALRSATTTALTKRSPEEIVSELQADGPLTGAANPYAVLIARTRRLCSRPSAAERTSAADDSVRGRRLLAAFNHGDVLRRTTEIDYEDAVAYLENDARYSDPETMAAALRGLANGPWR